MKLEIEVELPEDIARKHEVIAVRTPVEGDLVIVHGKATKFDIRTHNEDPRIILKRKLTPRDWWPRWVLADSIKFQSDGMIRFSADDGNLGFWRVESNLLDFSWIPEHLRRSGVTVENPWKGEQQ